jgi:hypothetical protein
VPYEWWTDILACSQITLARRAEEESARGVSICQSKITEAIVVKIRFPKRG